MIQFLADGIDQLDLALDQLAIEDRNFDRFALMLVDNVVELTLHQFARDRATENTMWGRLRKPKFDPQAVETALGRSFPNKVRLAARLNLLSDSLAESILYLHDFRNTAYHQGVRHEGILHSLALFYFRNACEVLTAFKPLYWSSGSSDFIPHRARKYIGDVRRFGPSDGFRAVYSRLAEVAESLKGNLIGDLAVDMAKTVDEMDSTIQFLADDAPQKVSRDKAVVEAQAWALAFTDEAKTFARLKGYKSGTIGAYVEWLEENFDWPFKSDPIPGWRKRHESLQRDKDEHRALKKYCDFLRQTEIIRSTLNEAAVQLDAYIDEQVDRARGK